MTVLIIDDVSNHTPLQWELYNHLLSEHKDVIVSNRINDEVSHIVKEDCLGRMPKLIMFGFARGKCPELSTEWLNKYEVPISIECSDPLQFINMPGFSKRFWGLKNIKHVFVKWHPGEHPLLEGRIRNYMDCLSPFRDATIQHMPWSVKTKGLQLPDSRRIIRASMVCNIGVGFVHHNRRELRDRLRNQDLVMSGSGMNQSMYLSTLEKSHISVCDTSTTGLVLQKHLEAIRSGCLLFSDHLNVDYLEDGTDYVFTKPGTVMDDIKYWLQSDRKELLIRNAFSKLEEHHSLEDNVKTYLEAVLHGD